MAKKNENVLPEGWEWKKLETVTKIVGGGTPSRKNESYYTNGNIAWVTVKDMKKDLVYKSQLYITKKAVKESSSNIIPKGNIVIATRVGLGKVCKLMIDAAINQDLKGLIPLDKSKTEIDYLFYWFKSISTYIQSHGTGATVKGVKLNFIKTLTIPLPPLAEQQRLVKKLDAAFERIDKAIALVKTNLEEIPQLRESAYKEKFKKAPLSILLGDFLQLKRGYDLPKRLREKGKYPLFGANGVIDYHKDYKVKGNGVITGRSGSIGHIHYVEENFWPLNTSLYVKDFKDNHPLYSYYVLKSKSNQIKKMSSFAAVPTLDRKQAHKIPIKIHDRKNQEVIGKHLLQLDKNIEQLAAENQAKLEHLEQLKKSLLDQAFKGKL